MPSFTSADPCPCCGDKICFQEWIASWSCSTLEWTGPVTDNRVCLPAGISTAWTKIAGDASGCEYRKRVPYAPAHACTINGDCSGLGDTATPALPFGGAPPDDCPCEPCIEDCGCFSVGATIPVSFAGVLNAMPCQECGATGVFWRAGTGTLGTYTLTRVGACDFVYESATGPTVETATGPTGAGCPGGGSFSVFGGGLIVELSFDGVTTWTLTARGTEFGVFFIGTAEQGDCSAPLVFTNTIVAYNPCGGNEDYLIDGTGTVVFPPCTP
jgi:hypothetical protein